MDLGLHDRTYVVTGGSTGLGFATARVLVDEGANVVIVSRRPDAVEQAVAELGDRAAGIAADLAEPTTPAAAIRVALDRFGRVDGGLVSVGGPPPGSVTSTTDEQWRSAFESVFLGSVRMARELYAAMAEGGTADGGAIALVLSVSAVEVFPGLTTSNGLRPGLAMLVTDLADEVGPRGTRVMGLLPGRIATDRIVSLDAATGDPAAAHERATAAIPLRRYGRPEEFGRVAAFVLSPAASYLTGSLVTVDGGSTRHP